MMVGSVMDDKSCGGGWECESYAMGSKFSGMMGLDGVCSVLGLGSQAVGAGGRRACLVGAVKIEEAARRKKVQGAGRNCWSGRLL